MEISHPSQVDGPPCTIIHPEMCNISFLGVAVRVNVILGQTSIPKKTISYFNSSLLCHAMDNNIFTE